MAFHIIDEAKRCLNCKKPQCVSGCPIKTNIPQMVQMLLGGEIGKAGEMLFENNPLSLICSLVCNHDKQCEGHCVLAKTGGAIGAVHVSTIEHYISDHYLDSYKPETKIDKERRVAIIGAGPSGLTIAIYLAKWGYNVTLFEAREKLGGVLRYGIPDFRLPKTILDRYAKVIKQMGIKYRPNIVIGQGGIVMDDLFRDGYKAVFIGTGVWKPKAIGIKGESLGHVHFAINYLKNPDVYDLGDKVIVIGSGNSAFDVARTALRKGSKDITCFSRTGEEQQNSSRAELEYAMIEGMNIEYFKRPLAINDDGVFFISTQIVEENGEKKVMDIPGTEQFFEADSVIIAISQGPRSYIVSTTSGIETDNRGLLVIDNDGETTREGVFASGDVVSGAKTVVEAVANSKLVAKNIADYVESKMKID